MSPGSNSAGLLESVTKPVADATEAAVKAAKAVGREAGELAQSAGEAITGATKSLRKSAPKAQGGQGCPVRRRHPREGEVDQARFGLVLVVKLGLGRRREGQVVVAALRVADEVLGGVLVPQVGRRRGKAKSSGPKASASRTKSSGGSASASKARSGGASAKAKASSRSSAGGAAKTKSSSAGGGGSSARGAAAKRSAPKKKSS